MPWITIKPENLGGGRKRNAPAAKSAECGACLRRRPLPIARRNLAGQKRSDARVTPVGVAGVFV